MTNEESRKFGAEGGRKRAASLTKAERSEQAKLAAAARWGRDLPVAEYNGILTIGDLQFPCAVLSDGTRVLTETEFMKAMQMYRSGALSVRRDRGAREPLYLAFKNLKPFIDKHLSDVHTQSLPFRTVTGNIAHGIRADIIVNVCDVWLDARAAGVLGPRQLLVAEKAQVLKDALAKYGANRLVDEVTGFQRSRTQTALAEILEKFIAKELRPWVRTFPPEFYRELYRLKGWAYDDNQPGNAPKPLWVGNLTDNLIYKRIAPGVREELKRLTGRNDKGYLKTKLHSRLTDDIGHPKLREHLAGTVMLMKYSPDFETFMQRMDREYPIWGKTLSLPFPEPQKAISAPAVASDDAEPDASVVAEPA